MLTAAICEDEAFFASELSRLVQAYSDARGVGVDILLFSNGEALLASRQTPDLILMDVRLPGQDGMETVRQLREAGGGSQVIFITAYQEYVLQAFELEAVHYILKPVSAEKLFSALDRAVKRLPSDDRAIFVANGTSASRIPIKEILYCEALNHQIIIHTRTGQSSFFGTLDAVQEKLDGRFFRSHRSYLVNLHYVHDKRPGVAVMAGGDRVLIARRKQQEFNRRLLEACRKELI